MAFQSLSYQLFLKSHNLIKSHRKLLSRYQTFDLAFCTFMELFTLYVQGIQVHIHSIKAQINFGRYLEANVLGNLTWKKYSIPLGNFTGDGVWLFRVYFSHQVILFTMSMMASSIILLSSVLDHKHLGKGRIISYLLILVSPSPSMPDRTRLKSSYKLEMKLCHSAPASQLAESALFKAFPAGREYLPKYSGKTSSKIFPVAV